MSRKKKSGNENPTLQIIVFVTAILELADALVSIIRKFSG